MIFDRFIYFYFESPALFFVGVFIIAVCTIAIFLKAWTIFIPGKKRRASGPSVSGKKHEKVSEGRRGVHFARSRLRAVRRTQIWHAANLYGSDEEARLHRLLEGALGADGVAETGYLSWEGYRVFPQVSYGALISVPDYVYAHSQREGPARMRSLRADFVLVDAEGYPAVVIEHHGGGHWGDFPQVVMLNDEAKRHAIRQIESNPYNKAPLTMLETVPRDLDDADSLALKIETALRGVRAKHVRFPWMDKGVYAGFVDDLRRHGVEQTDDKLVWRIPPSRVKGSIICRRAAYEAVDKWLSYGAGGTRL